MSGPSVYLTWPAAELFKLPPAPLPNAIPPPVGERSFRSPFGINACLYNFVLRPEVPFIFASVYILLVLWLNGYNRAEGNQPWWISKQKPFKAFVLVHNILLSLYSAATFLALLRAISHTWPGLNNPNGLAGVADALCKMHGPRGLGDAATFNTTIHIWEVKNPLIHLGNSGNPDPTDVGRLWHEGLAFWGWVFYVSKFYEVLDTLIIVAKGKRSPTLQMYHHAGAMLCMWAGIRYMSPPIWMFVFINSGIHAMMYAYFALSALDVQVPQGVKRTLTSLQIAQFVFGVLYAAAHLFVKYDIPIATPYQVASTIQQAASSVSSAVASVTSDASNFVESPTATASLGALVKKLLLRAAGEEGLAERVHNKRGEPVSPEMAEKIEHFEEKVAQQYETKWRTEWTKVDCIDTSGEAFAIYLNLLYLLPLTLLFARFFVRAYTQRGKKSRKPSDVAKEFKQDAKTAEKDTEDAVEEAGKKAEDAVRHRGSEVRDNVKDLHDQLREDVQKMKDGTWRDRKVSDRVKSFERQVKGAVDKGRDAVAVATEKARDAMGGAAEKARDSAKGLPRKASTEKKQQNGQDSADGRSKDEPAESQAEQQSSRPETGVKDESASNPKPEKWESKPAGKESKPEEKKSKPKNKGKVGRANGGEPADSDKASTQGTDGASDDKNAKQKSDEVDEREENGKGKDNQTFGDATQKFKAEDESEEKQDENLEESQALRPGPDEPSQSGDDDKENQPPPEGTQAEGKDEDAGKQDGNTVGSQATRPGVADDSDAMGQSGSIISYASEKDEEAANGANGEEDKDSAADAGGDGR